PWPTPVLASEPYKSTFISVTASTVPCCCSFSTSRSASRQGPSVCDEEGPTPILNMSKTEIASCATGRIIYSKCNAEKQLKKQKLLYSHQVYFKHQTGVGRYTYNTIAVANILCAIT